MDYVLQIVPVTICHFVTVIILRDSLRGQGTGGLVGTHTFTMRLLQTALNDLKATGIEPVYTEAQLWACSNFTNCNQ